MAGHITFMRTTASILLATTFVTVAGCGYGEVSPCAYECATALYSICNRMAEDKLAAVTEHVAQAREAGQLSQQEAEWLEAIVNEAGRGDWQSAARACRAMMEDQVRGG
jgi:hypothetical protein